MNLLIVTNKYAPSVDPRAFRWTAVAEHWAGLGNTVDVVCAWEGGLPPRESRGGVDVHRVGGPLRQVIRKRLTGRDDTPREPAGPGRGGQGGGGVFSAAYSLASRVLANVYWPDYAWTWYFPARRTALRLLRERRYDAVITVSVPFTSHLVGLSLRGSVPGIPWLVDIGDPFSFFREVRVNNVALYGKLNVSAEKIVLGRADAVTVTTRAAGIEYGRHFPECRGKIRVVPPLCSIPGEDCRDDRLSGEDGSIRLVFVGTLYRAIRSPGFLLRMFDGLLRSALAGRLELHFFGNLNDCGDLFEPYRPLVGEKIFLHGVVERARVTRAMREANVLVNLGNKTSYQLPSKVVEYAAMGKPVLNIVTREGDSSADFFSSYGACMNVIDDGEGITDKGLADVVRFIKTPPAVDPAKNREFLSDYSVEGISGKYLEILTSPHSG